MKHFFLRAAGVFDRASKSFKKRWQEIDAEAGTLCERTAVLLYRDFFAEGQNPQSSFAVSEENFRKQMEYLSVCGFKGVALEEMCGGTPAPAAGRRVVLTFDGAHAHHHAFVLPLLKEKGFTATFFVALAEIGKPGKMEWPMIYDLAKSGMGVGPRGVLPDWLAFSNNYVLLNELLTSKQVLEKYTRKRVDFLSAPDGFFNRRLAVIARDIGFKGLCLADAGYNDFCRQDFFYLKRFSVRRHHGLKAFISVVVGRPVWLIAFEENLRAVSRRLLGYQLYTRLRRLTAQRGLGGGEREEGA